MREMKTLVILCGFAGLSGCVQFSPQEHPVRLYLLGEAAVVEGEKQPGEYTIHLQWMEFPQYALRSGLAVRTGNQRITYAPWDRWAEPVQAGIMRATREGIETLNSTLKVRRWTGEQSAPDNSTDITVQLTVQRFEGQESGVAVLEVRALLLADGDRARDLLLPVYVTDWQQGDFASLVRAHSININRLASDLVAVIRPEP